MRIVRYYDTKPYPHTKQSLRVRLWGQFYPKFGFRPAGTWSIKDPFGAPAEAFMALELKEGVLEGASGVVESLEEFKGL